MINNENRETAPDDANKCAAEDVGGPMNPAIDSTDADPSCPKVKTSYDPPLPPSGGKDPSRDRDSERT